MPSLGFRISFHVAPKQLSLEIAWVTARLINVRFSAPSQRDF